MSEEQDEGSKTEDPSEKKIADALERGNVPTSRETATLASMIGGYAVIMLLAADKPPATLSMATLLDGADRWRFGTIGDALDLGLAVALSFGLLFLLVSCIPSILAALSLAFQNKPALVGERIRPQWSRVSPVSGLKRMFGKGGKIELLKAVAKLTLFGVILGWAVYDARQAVGNSLIADPMSMPQRVVSALELLAGPFLVGLTVLAVIDLIASRYTWRQNLMMSREELKKESHETEGNPLVKQRFRSIMMSRARRRMMAQVPRATLVIANPTHYAIAMRYVRGETPAPVVLAKGMDMIALRIREQAEAHGVPIIEDKALARSMYDQVTIDRTIPPVFYKAVAELIHYVSSKRRSA